jgi:hypothetical protein
MPDPDSALLAAFLFKEGHAHPSVGSCNKTRLVTGFHATPDGAEFTSRCQVDWGHSYDHVINPPDAVPTAGSLLIDMQPPLTFAIAPAPLTITIARRPLTEPMSRIP